jgi:hypothetical protein
MNVIDAIANDGYNVLMVQPSLNDTSRLGRVGMGEVLRAEWWKGSLHEKYVFSDINTESKRE